MYNDVELHSPESNACGYHVIAFCLSRINHMSHYELVFSKLQCCYIYIYIYIYKHKLLYIQIFIEMQFTYYFHGGGGPRARTW